jgi:hypothetical protein
VSAPTVHPIQRVQPTHPPRWPYVLVPVLHLLAALTGPAYYLYAISVPVIGANIGAGLGLMWTAGWGLPWSLVPFNATGTSNQQDLVAFTACALFNVALVAGLFFVLYRRAATRMHVKTDQPAAPRRWHYALVPLVALASVLAGQLYLWLTLSGISMPGEGIGVAIFGDYWSALVGLPWSIWVWGRPDLLFGLGLTLCALLNIGLIAIAFWQAYRRARRRTAASH